ncbi:MAG: PHP domain-containing protein [Coriobacteriia bacterium]
MPGPDLHLHSTASDGVLTPAAIVELAARVGCPAIAITDHDSVDGVTEALEASAHTSVTVIPGVELSAGMGERDLHLLGYHIDHTDPALLAALQRLRTLRVERAERIVSSLHAAGLSLGLDDVLGLADGGAVGRAHIAQLLVSSGQATSVEDAFRRLLGRSAPHFVPKPLCSPAEVIGWIRNAGGVAVLAHPGLRDVDDLVPGLVDAGLAGIEAYHSAHDAETVQHYVRMAEQLGLIVTGGSDFHGLDRKGDHIGSANVPAEVVDLLAAAHARELDAR